jgi:predicted ATP-grasp superfamily ATP-dependent carboligase
VPAPASAFPETAAELAAFAATASFPVVAKNREPWVRLSAPAVPGTTLVGTPEELLALGRGWGPAPSVILQDYIPQADAQDWIVHLYCDASSKPVVTFTGVKVRSWPPRAGMTACAYTVPNPALARLAQRFCAAIGFSGVADLDWRLDLRDGQYKLVDFNPRVGAQFRLFETTAGVDVVRALHLDLTGRRVPGGTQVDGRRLIVENIDVPARLTRRRSASAAVPAALSATSTELAWLARDDPFPFLVMLARLAAPAVAHVRQTWRSRAVRRRAGRGPAARLARQGGLA